MKNGNLLIQRYHDKMVQEGMINLWEMRYHSMKQGFENEVE